MGKVIGIDVGTSSICALLLDTDRPAEAIATGVENDSWLRSADEKIREQDPTIIRQRVAEALGALLEKSGARTLRADGLAVTGQMHGFLLADERNRPLTPLITWQDRRAEDVSPRGASYLEEFLGAFTAETAESLCMKPAAGYMGPALYTLQSRNLIQPGARRALSIYDWVAAQLAEAQPVTTPQTAQASGMFLPVQERWCTEVAVELGIEPALLPPVAPAATRVGIVGAEESVVKGVPVFAAPGDNQTSFLGSVRNLSDSTLIHVGTAAQISIPFPDFVGIEGVDTRLLWDGQYLLVGASLCGGRAFNLLAAFIAGIGDRFFSRSLAQDAILERMTEVAATETDLQCRTTFAGTRTRPAMRALISNLSEGNFAVEDLITALGRGVIQELKDFCDQTAAEIPSALVPGGLVGSGNALRKSRLLRRCAEDVFGMKLEMPRCEEEAALGAALTAAIGAGIYASPRAAAKAVSYVDG